MKLLAIIALAVSTALDCLSTLAALKRRGFEASSLLRASGGLWLWVRVGLAVVAGVLVWRDPSTLACSIALGVAGVWTVVAVQNWKNAAHAGGKP